MTLHLEKDYKVCSYITTSNEGSVASGAVTGVLETGNARNS